MVRQVKGRGFEKLATVDGARAKFLRLVPRGPLGVQRVRLHQALGRTLAKPVRAEDDVPPFHRAAMDGFAVRAPDTFGATATNPLPLRLVGDSQIGGSPSGRGAPGTCFRIDTGAMLPTRTDAVVMFEHTRAVHGGLIEVQAPVTPWENVSKRAEDVRSGETLLREGTRIEPQDIALAAALGLSAFSVARKPRVGVISTGDELVGSGRRLRPGQIRDANRPGALAAAAEAGAHPVDLGIARDDPVKIKAKVVGGLRTCDLLIISGGTSVGAKDFVPEVIRSLGRPGIVVHGVGMRPGYPVGLGAVRGVPVVLLPGSPVAAALNVEEFAVPALLQMLGPWRPRLPRRAIVAARASRRIPGAPGLRTYARVVLHEGEGGLTAEPIRTSGSSILSSLVRASGIVVIPPEKEGVEEGEAVEVILLRSLAARDG